MNNAPKIKPSITVEVALPLDTFNALMRAFWSRNPQACPEEESSEAVHTATAEQAALVLSQWAQAQQLRALDKLAPFRAKLVRQVHGIGCTKKTIAELAREHRMPRRRLSETLKAALAELSP